MIEPRDEPRRYDRDYVVMLGDWLHRDPNAAPTELRGKPAAVAGGMPMQGMSMAAGMPMGGAADGAKAMPQAGMSGAGGGMDIGLPDLSDLA